MKFHFLNKLFSFSSVKRKKLNSKENLERLKALSMDKACHFKKHSLDSAFLKKSFAFASLNNQLGKSQFYSYFVKDKEIIHITFEFIEECLKGKGYELNFYEVTNRMLKCKIAQNLYQCLYHFRNEKMRCIDACLSFEAKELMYLYESDLTHPDNFLYPKVPCHSKVRAGDLKKKWDACYQEILSEMQIVLEELDFIE